jgi:NAD/NADP transhydrogenase alpha subunit
MPLPEKVATVASQLSAKNLSHLVDQMAVTVDVVAM